MREEDITLLAASVAYYAFVSLVPLVLLSLAVASVLGGEVLADRVSDTVKLTLTPTLEDLLERTVESTSLRRGAAVVGAVTLAWSGLRVFRGLDEAFARIYDVPSDRPLLTEIADAVTLFSVMTLAVAAMVVASTLFAVLGTLAGLPAGALSAPSLFVTLFVAFLPLYYVFPDAEMTARKALPGALLAAGGWVALHWIFSYYVTYGTRYDAYGILGGTLLLVTWFYLGGIVILVGAVVNKELAVE